MKTLFLVTKYKEALDKELNLVKSGCHLDFCGIGSCSQEKFVLERKHRDHKEMKRVHLKLQKGIHFKLCSSLSTSL